MPKRKRKGNAWVLIIYLILFAASAILFIVNSQGKLATNSSGTLLDSIPQHYSFYGIDISHYQKKINWQKLAKFKYKHISITFIFIKATEGVRHVDPAWETNWSMAKKYGFVRGAYHYFKPHQDPIQQMRHFTDHLSLETGDLAPVLDVEEEPILISAKRFVENVKLALQYLQQTTNMLPILYTNYAFYKKYFATQDFQKYPLWIAHYYKKTGPDDIAWDFWQFHDKLSVDGISGNVDMNIYCCSFAEFKKLLKD